jgi:hypothetical protein
MRDQVSQPYRTTGKIIILKETSTFIYKKIKSTDKRIDAEESIAFSFLEIATTHKNEHVPITAVNQQPTSSRPKHIMAT